jgi:hypothetical protein
MPPNISPPQSPKHRWPKSVHSQLEAILQASRNFGSAKRDGSNKIRSIGTWKAYRRELHKFVDFYLHAQGSDLLDAFAIESAVSEYLSEVLDRYSSKEGSRQSYKTILAAMSHLQRSHHHYIHKHGLNVRCLIVADTLSEYRQRARKELSATSAKFGRRGYDDPVGLIAAIRDPQMQLLACLQYEGGLRTEGVGAPSGSLNNPITTKALKGFTSDPITGGEVGVVCAREKGGKYTDHYISVETYQLLSTYLSKLKSLKVDYSLYLQAINEAARATQA